MKKLRGTIITAGAMLAAMAVAAPVLSAWSARTQGEDLYLGRRALQARIAGHPDALPAMTTRCVNCHDGAPSTGGALTSATLTLAQHRRGGPLSIYDQAALCRVLRQGVDPALVVVDRGMPRFDIDDADCGALWAYLSSRR